MINDLIIEESEIKNLDLETLKFLGVKIMQITTNHFHPSEHFKEGEDNMKRAIERMIGDIYKQKKEMQ